MAHTPKEIEEQVVLSDKALAEGDGNRAFAILKELICIYPNNALVYRKIGALLMQTNTPQNALSYLNKSIELSPNNAESWVLLGMYHKKVGDGAKALDIFQKSITIIGDNTQILYEAMQIHKELGNFDMALKIIQKIVEMECSNVKYILEYARILKMLGREEEALEQYTLLVYKEEDGIPVEAISEWFELMIYFRKIKEANQRLKKLTLVNPNNAFLMNLYARSLEAGFDFDNAFNIFLKAHKIDPLDDKILLNLSLFSLQKGDNQKAKEYCELILKKNPLNITSIRMLGMIKKYTYESENFRNLQFALAHYAELSNDQRAELHYAAGKAFDDIDETTLAFEHYKLGGKYHFENRKNNDNTTLERLYNAIKTNVTRDQIVRGSHSGYLSDKPVFVVGMPRSGTTLIEQVLSSLDGVYGAGELPFCEDILGRMKVGKIQFDFHTFKNMFGDSIHPDNNERGKRYIELVEEIAPKEASRIIDKMPDNFRYLGFLYQVLPHASFIHSRRHPVEICLSAYRIYFSDGHYWSNDLRMMGKYYRIYHNLMQYWYSVLPEGTILDVRYEDMINDNEEQSKRLAQHIGIVWSDKSLKFHTNKNAVRTASMTQVRQPIYKTSMNRWRKYESYLEPLLDEIGDLVEAYELELISYGK